MPHRHRNRHSAFRAFIALCLVTIVLGIGYDFAHGLFVLAAIVGIPLGYVIGRLHEHRIHGREYRSGRQYWIPRNDPVHTITILPHTEPPEPGEPPTQSQPRPYTDPAQGWDDPLPRDEL